jgi:hypothetical protein
MPTPPDAPILPTHVADRYVQPLREGGSLPAVVDTGDGGLFVVKFRGAGQGPRALIAELVVGLLAAEMRLPVPELAVVELPEGFGAEEPDPEIRELLERSPGANVGLRYLDGAFNYDVSAAGELLDADFAARVVWLDAFVTNPDRTARNPNLLVWERRPWLIDHGSALYVHHAWRNASPERARAPFPMIADHVLLPRAGDLGAADAELGPLVDGARLAAVLEAVPEALLMDPLARGEFGSAAEARERYVDFLAERLREPRAWVAGAEDARRKRIAETPRRLARRR